MRWQGRRGSGNVEDRRHLSGRAAVGGGLGGLGLVIVVVYLLMGGDPTQLNLQQGIGAGSGAPGGVAVDEASDAGARFVSVVLADTEEVWRELFAQMGDQYREPRLVLFSGQVQSACGFASAAVGPFYCPGDGVVYIDLSFYDLLSQRFGASGDFAQAYVIAHEVGHHVQNLLGISGQVDAQRGRVSEREQNELSVRLELQADFLAGVWAHHAQRRFDILEPGDIEEALTAANAIGDDTLQLETQGRVVPDSFTHGTSEQRVRWFRLGFETGDLSRGDTFAVDRL
ncbi:MAG TPA: neutral zinc metallopeptidase [Candidatus Krumholzibacteria bacterium]|nr:neutral zinc metallopeptidase [Candidatus Krumholzibacteria bacterium]HPD70817.1 neutral zinc metallopeptidase [Candidatus Krumholzibacteria bacterium]HRY39483.1 neutral zinc metallopeptidase [Candidatus Krumholzibacteria bacterium]